MMESKLQNAVLLCSEFCNSAQETLLGSLTIYEGGVMLSAKGCNVKFLTSN